MANDRRDRILKGAVLSVRVPPAMKDELSSLGQATPSAAACVILQTVLTSFGGKPLCQVLSEIRKMGSDTAEISTSDGLAGAEKRAALTLIVGGCDDETEPRSAPPKSA